ncbi:MAG: long-chain fatty acid--CoA ligase [Myxococcota bacterium]
MTFKPKFESLVDIYKHSTSTFVDRPLFGEKKGGDWKWMSYGDFKNATDAFRAGLKDLGVESGDRVAVISNNRPEWAIAAYATYGSGACYVPMYEAMLNKDWKYILGDCEAKAVVVANESIRNRIQEFRSELPKLEHVIVIDGEGNDDSTAWADVIQRGKDNPSEVANPTGEDLAGFIYTSGTTGNPKGVKLTHKNLAYNVSAVHDFFPMSEDDRSLSFLPWAHSFGQTCELHGLFSMGASMGIAEAVDKIIPNLAEIRPTLLFSVPRIFNKIYDGLNKRMAEEGGLKKSLFDAAMNNQNLRKELAGKGRSSGWADFKHKLLDKLVFSKVRERFGGRLKYAFSGGAAISKQVAEFIDNLGITVYEGYGLTETSPIATANYPGNRKIGSIGKPIPGVTVTIDKEVTGDDVNGEIVIHGHNIMAGYHNLPEENKKVFTEDGGFRTGDMGRMDDEGFVYITGRIKEQYKLENGKYVVPSPLEELLKLSPYIANVLVFGDNKPFNVAIVVPDLEVLGQWGSEHGVSDEKLLTDPAVEKLIAQELEQHSDQFKQFEKVRKFKLIPDDFTTENGMLTPSLKVKRRIVINAYDDELNSLYG